MGNMYGLELPCGLRLITQMVVIEQQLLMIQLSPDLFLRKTIVQCHCLLTENFKFMVKYNRSGPLPKLHELEKVLFIIYVFIKFLHTKRKVVKMLSKSCWFSTILLKKLAILNLVPKTRVFPLGSSKVKAAWLLHHKLSSLTTFGLSADRQTFYWLSTLTTLTTFWDDNHEAVLVTMVLTTIRQSCILCVANLEKPDLDHIFMFWILISLPFC